MPAHFLLFCLINIAGWRRFNMALFIMGESKALNYWRTYGGFEMILVNKDNKITCTKGLMEQFTLANDSYTLRYTE